VISVELLNEEVNPEEERSIKEFLSTKTYTLVTTIIRNEFSRIPVFAQTSMIESMLRNETFQNAIAVLERPSSEEDMPHEEL